MFSKLPVGGGVRSNCAAGHLVILAPEWRAAYLVIRAWLSYPDWAVKHIRYLY